MEMIGTRSIAVDALRSCVRSIASTYAIAQLSGVLLFCAYVTFVDGRLQRDRYQSRAYEALEIELTTRQQR